MKLAKSMFIIATLIMVVVTVVVLLFDKGYTQIYGNDKASIVKYIHSLEEYKHRSIEILAIKDIDDLRFAGFLADGHPGSIVFQKNEDGNYLSKQLEINDFESTHLFLYEIYPWYMVVTNHENEVAKFQVNVNGQLIEQELTPNKKSVVWIELPRPRDNGYVFRDYKYYDANGQLIKHRGI